MRPNSAALLLVLTVLTTAVRVPAQSGDARLLFDQGRAILDGAVSRRDTDEIVRAAGLFRRAIEINPRFARAHAELAEALIWLDRFELAEQHIAMARDGGLNDVGIDLLEARLAVLAGRFRDAEQLFESVLGRQPYNADARVGVAILGAASGPTDRVVADLQSLARRFPEHLQLLLALAEFSAARGDLDAADRFTQLALLHHGDEASVHMLAARTAMQRDDFVGATRHATAATEIAPRFGEAWRVRAAAGTIADPDGATELWSRVIQLDPRDHVAWYARGVSVARDGRTDEALRSWRRAQEIRPDFELARLARENLALTELALDHPVREALGAAYRESGDALFDQFLSRQAERHYRRGLQLNPFDAGLRLRLGELYAQQGYRSRFLRELSLIRELAPDPSRDVIDTEAGLRASLARSVASNWGVDQFTVPRPRGRLAFYADGAPHAFPAADVNFVRYVASLVTASQNIDVVRVATGTGSRVENAENARSAGADLAVEIAVEAMGDVVRVRVAVVDPETAGTVDTLRLQRGGNDRLDSVAAAVDARIDAMVSPTGEVLARRFDRILVSLGSVDGLEVDSELVVHGSAAGSSRGMATITAVDDLVSEARFVPDGADRLVVGDRVTIPGDVPDEAPEPEVQPSVIDSLLRRVRGTPEEDPIIETRPVEPGILDRLFRTP